jgi:hypothetical protein
MALYHIAIYFKERIKMSIYFGDCEADGACPGLYSMLEIGLVKLSPALDTTFWRNLKPITEHFDEGALKAIGMTREQTQGFGDPGEAMTQMVTWVESTTEGRPVFVSDNNGFDWQFVNYYCHYYVGRNPFGFSSRRIGDFYSGLKKDWFASSKWKSLRKTKHTHNALDDAMGNAEAFTAFCKSQGIKAPGL